jgi:hypothetical protein
VGSSPITPARRDASSRSPSSAPTRSDATREISALNESDARIWLRHARRGELEAAWRASDRILQRSAGHHDWTAPRHQQQIWTGAPLVGRRVLIRCYHGLGDTIQFIRYVPLVRAIACEVIVWAQPALIPLLRTATGIDQLLPLHDGVPEVEYDVDVEVMELAHVFRSTLQTIPAAVPYLLADPAALCESGTPRIGLAWRAGAWDARRSIPFELFTSMFEMPGISCCSLQHEPLAHERHERLHQLNTSGLLQTAQSMRALDLIITIDGMSAHLAGALGVPVWTLLSNDPDWRWMEDRSDSPWYPSMRLFRQRRAGSWEPVIDEVIGAVETEFRDRR